MVTPNKLDNSILRCNHTTFQLKIPIFFGRVLNFPRVSTFFCQFYCRNDRERNGTVTGMSEALKKIYQ